MTLFFRAFHGSRPSVAVLMAITLAPIWMFSLSAQGTGRPGRVSGDAYVVTKSGEIRRLAANRVFIAHNVPKLFQLRDSLCEVQYNALLSAHDLARTNSLLTHFPGAAATEYAKLSVSVATDINGHYSFESVPPGRFLVWVLKPTSISPNDAPSWLAAEGHLAPGGTAKVDLNNTTRDLGCLR